MSARTVVGAFGGSASIMQRVSQPQVSVLSPLPPTQIPIPQSHASIPPSRWTPSIHPQHERVMKDVDSFFLRHWPFPNDKARKKFAAAGLSKVACFAFPNALDDRIQFACRLVTLLFLVDDALEHMSLEEGTKWNERLFPISRGDALPDRNDPVEWITYEFWQDMRAHDRVLADKVMEPVFTFMRAQTHPQRLEKKSLGSYFEYRDADFGKDFLLALMQFGLAIDVPAADLALAEAVDRNYAKHITIINDIWSYEKEVLAAETLHEEGGILCSAVDILAQEVEVSADVSKRVLYNLCREMEKGHEKLVEKVLAQRDTPELRAYFQGLEYQMSGNEIWCRTTLRYLDPNDTQLD